MEVPCDKPFPEEQARLYLRDIILGLEYCESGAAYPLGWGPRKPARGRPATGGGGVKAEPALRSSCQSVLLCQSSLSGGGEIARWAEPKP